MPTFNDSTILMEPLKVSVEPFEFIADKLPWFDEVNEQLIKAELSIERLPNREQIVYAIRTDADSPNLSGWQLRQVSAIFANLILERKVASFSLHCAGKK